MLLPLNVSCLSKIQISFTFLVTAYPGSPGQKAVIWVCVCVCDYATIWLGDFWVQLRDGKCEEQTAEYWR